MNFFKKISGNTHILLGLLFLIVIFEVAYLFTPKKTEGLTIEEYADQVVLACKDANYRPTCYDEVIPRLMDHISMEDAFKVTFLVQGKDRVYAYCHVLAHELSAREVMKDPTKWKDVATRVPSGMCSNGGIHGAFQERFRGEFFTDEELEVIKPDLLDLCEKRKNWSPTGLEQASCYHAMGHLTMYLTEAEINRSLRLCDDLALKPGGRDYRQLCYDGAFMQIFQPLEPEDFSLIKGKEITKETHKGFCDKFTGQAKGSCWSEGWPLYRQDLEKPEFLTWYCGQPDEKEQDRCFSGVMYVMTAMFNLDSGKVLAYCPGLREGQRAKCFSNAASRMIEVDYRNISQAVDLCNQVGKHDPKYLCLSTLLQFSTYNYKVGSAEFYKVCNALPGTWKDRCLKNG